MFKWMEWVRIHCRVWKDCLSVCVQVLAVEVGVVSKV